MFGTHSMHNPVYHGFEAGMATLDRFGTGEHHWFALRPRWGLFSVSWCVTFQTLDYMPALKPVTSNKKQHKTQNTFKYMSCNSTRKKTKITAPKLAYPGVYTPCSVVPIAHITWLHNVMCVMGTKGDMALRDWQIFDIWGWSKPLFGRPAYHIKSFGVDSTTPSELPVWEEASVFGSWVLLLIFSFRGTICD